MCWSGSSDESGPVPLPPSLSAPASRSLPCIILLATGMALRLPLAPPCSPLSPSPARLPSSLPLCPAMPCPGHPRPPMEGALLGDRGEPLSYSALRRSRSRPFMSLTFAPSAWVRLAVGVGVGLGLGLGLGIRLRIQLGIRIGIRLGLGLWLGLGGRGLLPTPCHSILHSTVGQIAIFSRCQP